jgi:ABC-type sugar transport system ATPase subunit
VADALILKNVEKEYGGLRPLRVRDLIVSDARVTMLIGFDRPSAEAFVNIITGAALPERGEVVSLGTPTASIANGDEWLKFVERFGIVSDRIVLLEGMTVAQNLAISFDLKLEPVPDAVMMQVQALADEVEIPRDVLETRVAEATPLVRVQTFLARALAFDPALLVLEHPTANLSTGDAVRLAEIVKRVSAARRLATVGLLMDEKFAKTVGGRLLTWQPATGETRERGWSIFGR